MGSLIKYEFRKLLNIKFIILVLTGIFQVMFLVGMAAKSISFLCISSVLVLFCAIISISVLAILTIRVLSKEFNTKQGYMLFMTPNSSYKILGAKIVESVITIFGFGALFILLEFIDVKMLTEKNLLSVVFVELESENFWANAGGIALNVISILFNVVAIVAIAFLAVIVSATLLNGKKYSGLLSFGLFLVINFIVSDVITRISTAFNLADDMCAISIFICVACTIVSVIIYYIGAWLMENKLSI